MKASPKISIITLTYNQEPYIKQCINSVLKQTYKNWEMIVIDDHSSDKTERIVEEYVKKDSRIKYYRHKKNWGIKRLVDSYNQALSLTTGSLIAILEGDDYWPRNKLEVQLQSFNDTQVVLSYGDCITINKDNTPLYIRYYRQQKMDLNNIPLGSLARIMMSLNFFIIPATIMIKKTSLLSIGGFIKTKDYPFIDIPTILGLTLQGKFHYTERIMGYYRKHINSSWFTYIMNDTYIIRQSIQVCVLKFMKKNKKYFPSLLENENNIQKYQKGVLNHYKKGRNIYILLRYVMFSDIYTTKRYLLTKQKNRFLLHIFISILYMIKPIFVKSYYTLNYITYSFHRI